MVSQKQEAKALTPGHRVQEHVLSHGRLFGTPWTVARQAPLSMGFSRQEYCTGFPWPSPGDLPDPGIEPVSPAMQADSLPLSHLGSSIPMAASC